MSQTQISTWLQFALQQMAAESYLDQSRELSDILIDGNNDRRKISETQFSGVTRFVDLNGVSNASQITGSAQAFVSRYQIHDHHANDATGFSATLMFDNQTQSYTLSFRSLEYKDQAQGGDWERDGRDGAAGEVATQGFAFGQLVSMERYYRELKASGKLPQNAVLNVTGYSLGGHLATVFTELHTAEIQHTYTFNGAGRGDISGGTTGLSEAERIGEMLDVLEFNLLQLDPTGSMFLSGAGGNVQSDARYQAALLATKAIYTTSPSTLPPGEVGTGAAFQKITQLFGHATSGVDTEVVANSGVHGPITSILIEGQPLLEGYNQQRELQYGNSHSITLMVDSLALQSLFETLDPNLIQTDIENIFKASSAQRADTTVLPGRVPLAEGNTLEQALDALRRVFHNPASGPFHLTTSGRQPGDFGNLSLRNQFYTNLAELQTTLNSQTFSIEPLVQRDAQGRVVPRLTEAELIAAAQDPTDTGLAYRYALRALNPFAVVGADYFGLGHTADGRLSLYDSATGFGELTDQYLLDRAAFLLAHLDLTTNNQEQPSDSFALTHYADVATGLEVPAALSSVQREYLFGGSGSETLEGSLILLTNDHLYGGGGNDTLLGFGGDDYLQGDSGNDRLDGGTGSDTLVGGLGFDTYVFRDDGIDLIEDGDGRGQVVVNNQLVVGGIHRAGDAANTFLSSDGAFRFVQSGTTLTINDTITIQNWDPGELGISLEDQSALPTGVLPTIDYTNGYTSQSWFGTEETDTLGPLGGGGTNSVNETVYTYGGDDMPFFFSSSLGNHVVFLGAGHDYVEGALGHDRLYGEDGRDILLGGAAGDDVLDGGAGEDLLKGGPGNDVLRGGADNDGVQGDSGNDLVLGEGGDDVLTGDSVGILPELMGNDYVDGGSGADWVFGMLGDDHLLGGIGDDRLYGDQISDAYPSFTYDWPGLITPSAPLSFFSTTGGNDLLDGGDGNDYLQGDGGDDILLGGADNDTLFGDYITYDGVQPGNDFLDGGSGIDTLYGGPGNDTLLGGSGDDRLYGDFFDDPVGGDDVLDGGVGRDELRGGRGNDVLYGGTEDDQLFGEMGDDILLGEAGIDILQGGEGNDELYGGTEDDRLFGETGDDVLSGDEGADELQGGDGHDILFGGDGDDTLFGGNGDDVLIGGDGTDILIGGAGNDTYLFNLGDGAETIFDTEGLNILAFGVGISSDMVTISAGSLLIRVGSEGDEIHIDGFDPTNPTVPTGITQFVFADGTQLSHAQLIERGFDLLGTTGNDVLSTGTFYRRVYGLDGDDQLIGGMTDNTLDGGTGLDQLWGQGGNDLLFGGGGDDILYGEEGNDQLLGQDGNDLLDGGAGDDTLDGGIGNDQLTGGVGNDVYVFHLGDGIDQVVDDATPLEGNLIAFGAGITASSLIYSQSSNALTIEYGMGGDSVQLLGFDPNHVTGSLVVSTLQFTDGTVIDLAELYPGNRPPTVAVPIADQTAPEDALWTFVVPAGTFADVDTGDTLTYGATLADGSALSAWLSFDPVTRTFTGTPDDAQVGTIGLTVTATDTFGAGVSDTFDLVVTNINEAPVLAVPLLDQSARETEAFTYVVPADAFADEDTVHGDTLSYTASLEDGSPLPTWLGFDPVTRTFSGTPQSGDIGIMTVRVVATDAGGLADSDVFGLTVMSQAPTEGDDLLIGGPGVDVIQGLGGNDIIYGLAGNDGLYGGAGDDQIIGGLGNDTLGGESGSDTYLFNLGDGIDRIIDSVGGGDVNTVLFGPGIDASMLALSAGGSYTTLRIDIGTGGDAIDLAYFNPDTAATPWSITQFQFADGTVLPYEQLVAQGILHSGTAGNDLLIGTAAQDTMIGGLGDDTYVNPSSSDLIVELAGEGMDWVRMYNASFYTDPLPDNIEGLQLFYTKTIDFIVPGQHGRGNELDNIIYGNHVINTLWGGAGDDYLDAGDNWSIGAYDKLYGEEGNDTMTGLVRAEMYGGPGDDTYILKDGFVGQIFEGPDQGIDTILNERTTGGFSCVSNVENMILTGSGATNAYGNELNNMLIGNDAVNTLSGLAGDDTLIGGGGDDSLLGGDGNDVLDGGAGADSLEGGAGDDTYLIDETDTVTEGRDSGIDTIHAAFTYTLGNHLENLTLIGTAAINGTGNSADNILDGSQNSAANVLTGGGGDDTYIVDGLDTIVESTRGGTDTIQIAQTYTLQANLENLTLLGGLAIDGIGNDDDNILIGNAASNTLNGQAGNDTLDGGAGPDVLIGGIGNDTYLVDEVGDVVTENAGEGTDTVQSTITYTLGANLENLTLTGSAAIDGTGNALNNVLTGNSAANVLDGGVGADALSGGFGDDTYVVDDVSDTVTEAAEAGTDTVLSSVTYTLGANVENLTLTGTAAIDGTGNGGDNILVGNSAANTLTGGGGDDTYVVGAGDTVVEKSRGGIDTVQSSVSWTLGTQLENLTLLGSAAIDGTGNVLDNIMIGNSAANVLTGGAGNDTYVVGAGDTVVESANGGTDTVQSEVTWVLGNNVENLTLIGVAAIDGTGNAVANVLTGNTAANVLAGGGGDDTYMVDSQDTVLEAANEGTDTVYSSGTFVLGANVENLTLTGTANSNGTSNALNNVLIGNSGANVLDGGAGADALSGGLGDDTYVVDDIADTVTEGVNEGIDTVKAGVSYTLGANVENLTLTGSAAINGTGNTADNILDGSQNSAANTLAGGAGNDTYVVGAGDSVVEIANEGTDTVQSNVTWVLGNNVENLTLTGAAAIDGTGNAANNVLAGNSADNVLTGLGGDDTYQYASGGGQDTVVDNSGAADLLQFGTGIDPLDLILSRMANDLRLSVSGTTDAVTIKDWYTSPTTNQVEKILAGNGEDLLNAEVDQLIQAMAQFTTDTGLSWDAAAAGGGTAQQQADFQAIVANGWQTTIILS